MNLGNEGRAKFKILKRHCSLKSPCSHYERALGIMFDYFRSWFVRLIGKEFETKVHMLFLLVCGDATQESTGCPSKTYLFHPKSFMKQDQFPGAHCMNSRTALT